MATAPAPEPGRANALFLLAVASALQTLASVLALPDWVLLSASGLGGPLVLAVLAFRARTARSWRAIRFLSALLASVAALAVVYAVASPSTAAGLLILVWLSWVALLPVCAWLALAERPRGGPIAGRR